MATFSFFGGDTTWLRRYGGPGYGWDNAFAIATDGSDNVYVTGGGSPTEQYGGHIFLSKR